MFFLRAADCVWWHGYNIRGPSSEVNNTRSDPANSWSERPFASCSSHRALPRKHPVALLQSDVLLAELYHVTVSTEQPAAWTPVALLQRHTLSRVTKASGEQCPTYSHGQERCSYTPRGDVEIEEEEKKQTKKRLIPTCNLPGKCFLQPKTQFWRSCLWRAEVWTHWCYSVSQTQAKMCYLRDKKNR